MGTLRDRLGHLIGALPAKIPMKTQAQNGVHRTSELSRAKSERGLRKSRCYMHMVVLQHKALRNIYCCRVGAAGDKFGVSGNGASQS